MASENTRVRNFVDEHEPSTPLMPLTHLTTLFGFRTIMAGISLDPQECKIFGDDLLYMFYGRPAYRATQAAASKLAHNYPVGFILRPEAVSNIKRVFPFDTGAYARGLYGDAFSENSPKEAYELANDRYSMARYVKAFYGSNKDYYMGSSKVEITVGNLDFELQGLRYLAKKSGLQSTSNGVDERSSAIEVQVDEPLDIEKAVLGILVPETILNEPEFVTAMRKWNLEGAQISTYVPVSGPGSEAWVGQFYQILNDLYQKEGFFSEDI